MVQLLDLPPEIVLQICRYVVPTDRVFILLLATEETNNRSDGFLFDRGYGFPVFNTALLRVCWTIHEICMALWLRKGRFRIDAGDKLGPRKCAVFLPNRFIRQIGSCELRIDLPFYPISLPTTRRLDDGWLHESWLLRHLLRQLLLPLDKDGNLRKLTFTVHHKGKNTYHLSSLTSIPVALRFFADWPLQLPAEIGGSYEIVLEGKVGLHYTKPSPGFVEHLNQAVERRLEAIASSVAASSVAAGTSNKKTTEMSFEEEMYSYDMEPTLNVWVHIAGHPKLVGGSPRFHAVLQDRHWTLRIL